MSSPLDAALAALPRAYPGPGGAAAVLKDGQVLARHTWGYANAERRIAFTPKSLFRVCSITKQFTCAVALDAFPDVSALDEAVAAKLPNLAVAPPKALHLCHNQSGLRDYWAVAMLLGSPVEGQFGDAEAAQVIGATRSLQFEPGTRFSYVNQNFRLLGDIAAERTGTSFADLLRTRVFEPAGMETALLAADTRALPDGSEGYEPMALGGFRPAVNNIVWTGDAGIGASLDDMIAWERFIDASRDDPASLYQRLSAPVTFADGAPAGYGFGLGRSRAFGRAVTGHGGALRGWRSHRMYVPSERISVVVMFNHLSNANAAAHDLLAAVLGEREPEHAPPASPPGWLGAYLEPQTGLSVRLDTAPNGKVRLLYDHYPAVLDPDGDGAGEEDGMHVGSTPQGLVLSLPGDNQRSLLVPRPGGPTADIAGRYHCAELGCDLTITCEGGIPYGGFSGPLGLGRMEQLTPIGGDLWALPCFRALDHTPPGDWTLDIHRNSAGRADRITVGCWLARGLRYDLVAGTR